MHEVQLKQLLEENVSIFLNNITRELEQTHNQLFDDFGFPMFGVISKDYHEQVYFQSYLESYTRKMINSMLKEMMDFEVADEIHWPEFEYKGIYNGYTNSECEKEFGFEFIDRDTRTGYRYSFYHYDEIEALLARGNVDKIKLVIWQNEDDPAGFEYGDSRSEVILLWELFQELFVDIDSDEIRTMYDMFVEYVSKAVTEANSFISLVTLPGFTPAYLHKTRDQTIETVRTDINKLTSFHINHEDYKYREENSKRLLTEYGLAESFLSREMEYSLVGTSYYAKSFLTSEYLYQYFKDNPMFDYTPIVSGYLKSIEQLLYAICTNYRNSKQVQLNMSGFTLGSYIYYLKDSNNEDIFREELRADKEIITDCLESYKVESRNNLFHKDFFNVWGRVDLIRQNTIFLYVVLLAAIDDELLNGSTPILRILNTKYDRLFDILDKQKYQTFTIKLKGIEYQGMQKEPRTTGIQYDKNGLIKNSITFKKFDYDDWDVLEISKTNIPSAIWIEDSFGRKSQKIW